MRSLILISFFACLFLHFYSKSGKVEHDTLTTQQSSIKQVTRREAALPRLEKKENLPPKEIEVKRVEEFEESEYVASSDVAENFEDDDLSRLPWDDIEQGWKANLKEYLVSIDPEKADDIFAAYMEEKKKYVERIDFSDTEHSGGEDYSSSSEEPVIEYDGKSGDLERMHVENLKGIFGDHYYSVEALHREYVESVQYLNRSSVKFSISF